MNKPRSRFWLWFWIVWLGFHAVGFLGRADQTTKEIDALRAEVAALKRQASNEQ